MMGLTRVVLAFGAGILLAACGREDEQGPPGRRVAAAQPTTKGATTVEEALAQRRSVRDFLDRPLSEAQLAQLAWAAQGVTDSTRGFRTAPSAGALYPIELYVVAARGVSRYLPREHAFELVAAGDRRQALAKASVNQTWVATAPVTFVVAAAYERTTGKYGERGIRYATIEVGHVCQSISLQAVALGLGSVSVGAFEDDEVRRLIGAPPDHRPLCLVCVGYPRVAP
jgi:SagB-type dehydrogenase family enzyme